MELMYLCLLTETWLRKGDTSKISEIKDLGYGILHQSRPGKGGGVAIAHKKHISVTRRKCSTYKSFEHIESTLKSLDNKILRIACVYRSCNAKYSAITDFCRDFDDYLDSLTHLPGKLLIAGDFNIHVEDSSNPDAVKFRSILESYGLMQHVHEITHISGGTLDLVLTRDSVHDDILIDNLICKKTITTSDHFFITFDCAFPRPTGPQRLVKTGRKIKEINIEMLKEDIRASDISQPEMFVDYDTATALYNKVLSQLLDKHAPLLEFSVSPNQDRWMNTACQNARTKRRKAERDHRRLKTSASRKAYIEAYKHANTVINMTRLEYYKDRLNVNVNNKKETFKIVNQLMDRDTSANLRPTHKPTETVCEELKDFFQEKVEKIYCDIGEESGFEELQMDFTGIPFENFKVVDEDELLAVWSEINKKECEADPIPVKLLSECFDEVKSILLFIINESLSKGTFPADIKHALVRPAIKDENGDINEYRNYRPISNLPFLSKLLEKCVHRQLIQYLDINGLHAERQSGYREHHSCETATMSMYNDFLCISDDKSKVILILLDLSAAFDTVNHNQLLKKLQNKFGLNGNVLKWFQSYLEGRSFSVVIERVSSKRCFLRIGVPQGSILGPILFILYTKELNLIAERHGLSIHLFADDTQLYIEFNPLYQSIEDIEQKVVDCLQEIRLWMCANKLKLNPEKTEVLTVQTRNNFNTWTLESISLGGAQEVTPSPVVKSLGVKLDSYLTFEEHIETVVKSCNIHLRNLGVIASKLSYELKRQLIHCFILSKLDYWSSRWTARQLSQEASKDSKLMCSVFV